MVRRCVERGEGLTWKERIVYSLSVLGTLFGTGPPVMIVPCRIPPDGRNVAECAHFGTISFQGGWL